MQVFLIVITIIFWGVFIAGPILVPKSPFRLVVRAMIMLTSFCCWLFWATVFIAQMHPLVPPMVTNDSVGWIAERWGVKPT